MSSLNPFLKQAALEVVKVKNDSDPQQEAVLVNVLEGGHTSGYAIVDSTFDEADEPSNEFRHIFIFPCIEVQTGEKIVVCTGTGTYPGKAVKVENDLVHGLYWNSKAAVWNDKGGDKARLIDFTVVNSVDVPPTKPPNMMKFK